LAVEPRRFCVDCHVQGGGQRAEGIACAACHAEPHAAAATTPAALPVSPLRDPSFCRRCHEFATPAWDGGQLQATDLPMQSTFTEWQAYRRAGGRDSCQSCHMPGGDHLMRGAHDIDLLKGALAVRAVRGRAGEVTFTLASINVGHRFPTGDLFRHLTLEVLDGQVWRVIHRVGRLFETRLDPSTLAVRKIEVANTTLAPGEARVVVYQGRGGPLSWRVRYHYGSERDEERALVSYDLLAVTIADGRSARSRSIRSHGTSARAGLATAAAARQAVTIATACGPLTFTF
jgi:hypothetical protein